MRGFKPIERKGEEIAAWCKGRDFFPLLRRNCRALPVALLSRTKRVWKFPSVRSGLLWLNVHAFLSARAQGTLNLTCSQYGRIPDSTREGMAFCDVTTFQECGITSSLLKTFTVVPGHPACRKDQALQSGQIVRHAMPPRQTCRGCVPDGSTPIARLCQGKAPCGRR